MFRFERREESIEILRLALKIRENESVIYYAMGNNLVARGNYTGAAEFYRNCYTIL